MSQSVARLACCLLVALAPLVMPPPARAADGLVLSSHTRYEVRPADREILVTVDIAATNVVPDTTTGRTYFTGLTIPIPAEATNVSAHGGGVPLRAVVSGLDDLTSMADIDFSVGVFYQQTYRLRLSFTITDGGGAADRETWVRQSFVAFSVWAIASDGNASVEVVLPAGYTASDHLDELDVVEEATATRMVANGVDPTTFFTYVTAEKESDRTSTTLDVAFKSGVGRIVLSAWPDDPDWATRLGGFLAGGLPILEERIGLAYDVDDDLLVNEHAYQHLGDYAGYYRFADDTINVRFDADGFVTLHEAAHVWFNGTLTADRWLLEGFASWYAGEVGTEIGVELVLPELTDEIAAHAFPLADWGDPGEEAVEVEDYGYAASFAAAGKIAELAGEDGLQAVWRATFDERRAYGLSADELLDGGELRVREWQRMLDLFEIETGVDFVPVWTEWVIGPNHEDELAARADARAAYTATGSDLDGWRMPLSTRMAMEWWEFDDAVAELDRIDSLVVARDELEADAAALDLDPTDDLREAFEADGIEAAEDEAAEQAAALAAIAAAGPVVTAELSVLEEIGLLWEVDPGVHLDAAGDAYEAGEDGDAVAATETAVASREALEDRGRLRVAVTGGAVLALDAAAMGLLFALRQRRRRRSIMAGDA